MSFEEIGAEYISLLLTMNQDSSEKKIDTGFLMEKLNFSI